MKSLQQVLENQINEAYIKSDDTAIDAIVQALWDKDVFYEMCKAEDSGRWSPKEMFNNDKFRNRLCQALSDACIECWDENF